MKCWVTFTRLAFSLSRFVFLVTLSLHVPMKSACKSAEDMLSDFVSVVEMFLSLSRRYADRDTCRGG